jgi:hypothetical protein
MSLASLQPFEMHLLPVAGEQDSGLTSIKRGDMPLCGYHPQHCRCGAIDMPRSREGVPGGGALRASLTHLEPSVHFLLLLRRQPEWLDRSSRDPQNQRELLGTRIYTSLIGAAWSMSALPR